jgi:hypothetical protein
MRREVYVVEKQVLSQKEWRWVELSNAKMEVKYVQAHKMVELI